MEVMSQQVWSDHLSGPQDLLVSLNTVLRPSMQQVDCGLRVPQQQTKVSADDGSIKLYGN